MSCTTPECLSSKRSCQYACKARTARGSAQEHNGNEKQEKAADFTDRRGAQERKRRGAIAQRGDNAGESCADREDQVNGRATTREEVEGGGGQKKGERGTKAQWDAPELRQHKSPRTRTSTSVSFHRQADQSSADVGSANQHSTLFVRRIRTPPPQQEEVRQEQASNVRGGTAGGDKADNTKECCCYAEQEQRKHVKTGSSWREGEGTGAESEDSHAKLQSKDENNQTHPHRDDAAGTE